MKKEKKIAAIVLCAAQSTIAKNYLLICGCAKITPLALKTMFAKKTINKVLLLAFPLCLFASPIAAQDITADGTTSTEINSPDDRNFDINGGDRAGDNLFHSFDRFSVPNNGSANFLNAPDINNIINRVTGGEISNIDGLIKASGSANLFLINPAGIVFGQNARLDIGGSFLSSTADSLLFSDGTEFSANNLQKPLLTINAPIGLNFRDNPSPITNNSATGLQVKSGNNIAFVGGDLNFDGGKLSAPGGRIELGSLGTTGTVRLNENGSLTFPENVTRANIFIAKGANVNIRSGGGGSIALNAKNLEITNNSNLVSGIDLGSGTSGATAGDVNIDADSILLKDNSNIVTDTQGFGSAGNINIDTDTLSLQNSSNLIANTQGVGNAGNITIKAKDISQKQFGTLFSQVLENAEGNGGTVEITTDSLLMDNSFILADNKGGKGNSGNVRINASGTILMDNGSNIILEIGSDVSPEITRKSIGNAGSIEIKANNLTAKKSNFFGTKSFGVGNAGDVKIEVADRLDFFSTTIITQSEESAVGNAGNIDIKAGSISLNGKVDGGVTEKTLLVADAKAKGNGGNIDIQADKDLKIDGDSTIITQVQERGDGTAGDIKISSPSVSLNNFSFISTSVKTQTTGKSGDIQIDTSDLRLDSGSIINADTENARDGGSININAQNLTLTSGGKITTSTKSSGSAGQIVLNVPGNINLDGSNLPSISLLSNQSSKPLDERTGIFADTDAVSTGNGGNIETISSQQFTITNNAKVAVNSFGRGNGGEISISADSLQLDRGGSIVASTEFGSGGNLNLKIDDILRLDNNSLISAKASQNASGGNLDIDAQFIVAPVNRNSDIIANAEQGRGGNINITTEGIFGLQQRRSTPANFTNDIDASSEFGFEGNISIDNPDVNPSQILVQPPENLVEPEELVAQACSGSGDLAKQNSFSITGRGGFPDSPFKPFTNRQVRISSDRSQTKSNKNTTETQENKPSSVTVLKQTNPPSSDEIIPARGIAIDAQGQIVLTRYPTSHTAQRNYNNAIDCNK